MNDADKLKQVRKELGLTQSEMASKMGYGSQQAISMIETGQRNLSNVARTFLEYIESNELNN